ncbi:ABC transporter permease subunit [Micromonospora zhanjiangensis]|uniref:ABC transporter permease subunit n=1 Tax=Micromonospora zhanjiangensis TaxID=1522057 RepID=A0ABV8KG23_9ACTN
MNLVRAELGRLAARGFVRLMVALLVVAFGLTVATTLAGSHKPTGNEVVSARQQADEQWIQAQQARAECLSRAEPGEIRIDPRRICGEAPKRAELTQFLDGVFVFQYQMPDLMHFLVVFLALFGFLVGASAIGAELTSGGMTNLLLWRPQRMVVLGTKLGTLLAGVLALAVVGGALYVGAFRLVAAVAGFPGLLDGAFWGRLALIAVRGLVLIGLATAAGFGIAALGRRTSAALGVVAAYAVVWELGARLMMEIVQAARPEQWMLSSYLIAWMSGRVDFWDRTACVGPSAANCDPSYTITWVGALAVLVVLVGGCLVTTFATFRRRDLA